jgi:peptidoglycan hydrolase-like protein with peptidoglycan-binding domain
MSRTLLLRLLVVVGLLGAGLHASSAPPADYTSVVDITFPASGDARFSDDYHNGRSAGRVHRATDLFGPMGSPIYAAMGGRVTWAPGQHGSAGYALQIRGTDGRLYAYYHLGPHDGGRSRAYAPGIAAGVTVERGQLIGYLGDSGNAAGGAPHLHFEIHDDRITDPYGTRRMNPHASLVDAVRRGDVVGRTGAQPSPSRDATRDPVLRQGDRGPAVATWQGQLNGAIGAGLTVDGAFGPATDAATRRFQSARGLVVDGIVGPASRAALGTPAPASAAPPATPAPAPAPAPSSPASGVADTSAILRLCDWGPAVATWQGQLNDAAGAGLVTDGIFGPATDRATRDFQRGRGIAVDGVVGPQSRAALGG